MGGFDAGTGGGGGAAIVHQLVNCSALSPTFGTAVELDRATATFSQSTVGPFTIARAIDGDLLNFGWAIDGQLSRPHTAAFETLVDTPRQPTGTRLLLTVHHSYGAEHALGRFRLAVTASARTTFANGNEGISTPGDVGADSIWTVLVPRRYCITTNGPITVLSDESLLVGDTNATVVDYVIEADTNLTGITGVRIEVLTHSSLPFNGPGLSNSNGNFVLSEFFVRLGDQAP